MNNFMSETEQRLRSLLEQRRRNRLLLLEQKAIYAQGDVPLRLLNQIVAEEREIANLEAEIQSSDGAEVAQPPAREGSTRRGAGGRTNRWAVAVGLTILSAAFGVSLMLWQGEQPAAEVTPTPSATSVAAGKAIQTQTAVEATHIAEATSLPPMATSNATTVAATEASRVQEAVAATMTALPTAPRTQPATIIVVTASPSVQTEPTSEPVSNIPYLPPDQAVSRYYQTINAREYSTTWNWLTPAFQKKYSENSYDSFVTWWDSVEYTEIREVRVIEETAQTALVAADLVYHLIKGNPYHDGSLRIYLVRDPETGDWLFNDRQQ